MIHEKGAAASAYSYIRFSTPDQALGDSERRQVEKAEAWAAAKGVVLDRSFADRGKSGWKGTNRKKGALGEFLRRIPSPGLPIPEAPILPGSYLIVENLDRLSREHPLDSIGLVRSIIIAGVIIVILETGQEYSEASVRRDPMQMMGLVFELGRGAGESDRKSKLIKASWERRRKDALEGIPLSGQCPAWLKLEGTRKEGSYRIVPERAEIVRRIFDMAVAGYGHRAITNKLNDERVPTWGGKRKPDRKDAPRAWNRRTVHQILLNPAVIGEYHPGKIETQPDPAHPGETRQVRVPEGDPIPGVYPVVVDLEVWQKVQESTRKTGGPISTRVSQIFAPLLRDDTTGEGIRYKYQFNATRGGHGRYLVSNVDAINRERPENAPKTKPHWWPYPATEYAILTTLAEIDWRAMAGEGRPHALREAAESAAAAQRKAEDLQRRCGNLVDAIELGGPSISDLVNKLKKLGPERDGAEKLAAEARKRLEALEMTNNAITEGFALPKNAFDPEARDVRLAMRAEIARRVEEIRMHPKDEKGAYRIGIQFKNGVYRHIRVIPQYGRKPGPPHIEQVTFVPKDGGSILVDPRPEDRAPYPDED